ncbi:MAG: protein kinase [Myxococcaceae bacterium]|nr:protein kinase [Myxococcaceae bacterium]
MSAPVAGRYHLLKKLATGGMAEVFLARQVGTRGFEKLVCLKRILPGYADNPDFVRMFVDEARIAADLRHPNLVSVFDAGEDEGAWYMVMEYLEGNDVAAIIRQAHARQVEVPLPVAVQVVADAARGLHAAHVKTDLSGRPMAIVHRDISPQNLFVTKDGITKVLDFGVARSAHRSSKTEVGVVKGKLGYVSPEQLEAVELDGRSDLYSLGVVLWELLVRERLYARASDAEVLRAIIEGRVSAPSTRRKGLPKDLDALVLKALAHDRDKRFATCEAFATALEDFLVELKEPSSPTRVKQWLAGLFDASAAPTSAPLTPGRDEKTKTRKLKPARKEPKLAQADDFLGAVEQFLGHDARRKTNLVPAAGPFIGREQELRALTRAFDEGARLVTLVGFGGMGKTRLAQQFAAQQLPAFEKDGGVWFVDLAECRTLEQVAKAVSQALDVQLPVNAASDASVTHAGRSLNSLGRALVVLDNFEQVVPLAEATVGAWLEGAPGLSLLVTSREALALQDEVVQPLESLPLGGAESPAMMLFRTRAEVVRPRALTRAELDDVAVICERLEGHPLALELAASRLAELSVREVRDRLRERFELLGGRASRNTRRHATLWNAIDWSWQLLSSPEQQALMQLSVFRGGFTIDAASAVIEVDGKKKNPVDLVRALHRKSLVRYFAVPALPKELRLGLLESIQEFAAEKLAASDDGGKARRRHAAHYLETGREWAREVADGTSLDALTHLEVERENLTEVFDRALSTMPPTQPSAATALGALEALEPVFLRKGPYAAHLALLDDALTQARNVGVKPATIARAMQQRGNLQRVLGRPALAVEDLSKAMTMVEATGEAALEGRMRRDLAVARFVSGDVESARDWLVSALSAARARKDEALVLQTLSSLAIVQVAMGEVDEAALCCDEGLPLARKRGDSTTEARLLGSLGTIYQDQDKLDLALTFFSEAVARARAVRDVRLEGYFTGKRGGVLVAQRQLEAAQPLLEDAINRLSEVGDLRHEGLFLTYLAAVQLERGQVAEARVTLSAAQVRLETVKDPLTLTALALRRLHVEVVAREAGPKEARVLLADVRAARGSRPARTSQSEEVRIAARALDTALAG